MDNVSDMIEAIEEDVRATRWYLGKEALDARVMRAMARVPRERFVPVDFAHYAYCNRPLPIDCGQTISQPFIVALMTDLLQPDPDDVVLEIGTGSCYQAAVLSLLVRQVYTVEVVPELARSAEERLRRLGYANVEVRAADGYYGWPEHAPYDGIIVTAAAPQVPEPLIAQLKPGGHLVIPVGLPRSHQELLVVDKAQDGTVERRSVLPVAFVPLTADSGARVRGHEVSRPQ
jgi:protein-L-isoaspartate(D-aspartate) O-methyltransferase